MSGLQNNSPPMLLKSVDALLQELVEEELIPPAGKSDRLRAVEEELLATGTYTLSSAELDFGGKLAWRNNARCIGRLVWRQLIVRDLRHLSSSQDIFESCVEHLIESTNGGQIKPTLTVFAPGSPTILNSQLIRYADDPEQAQFVERLRALGWEPNGKPFQVLPLAIQTDSRIELFELPAEAVLEVALEHPEKAWFKGLGLRWHALPVISNNLLEVGGLHFPCCFSGWYMGTEIGARNLSDPHRYNLLPKLAWRFGFDISDERTLWRDLTLVELNRAVLHSFTRDGVTIVDHHTASKQFLKYMETEEKASRKVNADWSWIVPPLSGGATPVFHTPMEERPVSPDFLPRSIVSTRSSQEIPI